MGITVSEQFAGHDQHHRLMFGVHSTVGRLTGRSSLQGIAGCLSNPDQFERVIDLVCRPA